MLEYPGIPKGVAIAIDDLVDNCAEIKEGQEVVLQAHVDGTCGGDNLVDPQVLSWLQAAIQRRGANVSMLWIDEPFGPPHEWRLPRIFMAALEACDVIIRHSFDFETEEFFELREKAVENGVALVRNFATTASLLNTAWAQTPHELVAQIRWQTATAFQVGLPFQLTDESGTHLEGFITKPESPAFKAYTNWRNDDISYRPFPEWCTPPIGIEDASGIFVFDRTLTWWSRYIGVPPYFKDPIRLTIEKNRIAKIEGKEEAAILKNFLSFMETKIGDTAYNFSSLHSGVHPQAEVGPHQCPSPLHRRMVEHGHCCNIHGHIGRNQPNEKYPYWTHITADIRNATWRVGDQLVYENGHMTALDHPDVLAVAAKYPDRPGLKPEPRHF